MRKTYTLGTLGQGGGGAINYAGGLRFELIDNGEFTNKAEARQTAAELARMWADDSEHGTAKVAIVVSADKNRIPDLLTVATATRGRKRVTWS